MSGPLSVNKRSAQRKSVLRCTEFEVINGGCWLQVYTSRNIGNGTGNGTGIGTGIDVSRSLLESMRHLLRLVYNEGRL